MRTAFRAGPPADTTVTPTPTASPTSTVRGSNTSDPEGSVTPNPRSSASSPSAASTPRPRPITDETSPVRAPAPSTKRNTWRRLAPTIRSRASSLVRCPTMIENVLKMVNPPTNSEMNAKTSSVGEKPEGRVDRVRALAHHGLPGNHLHPGGQHPGDGLLHGGLAGPGRGHHVDVVELAALAGDGLRGGQGEGGHGRPGQVVGRAELGDAGGG